MEEGDWECAQRVFHGIEPVKRGRLVVDVEEEHVEVLDFCSASRYIS